MNPEDLADTIHVIQTNSVVWVSRPDQPRMVIGVPVREEDVRDGEGLIRDYVRDLIRKAIEMDRESRRQAEDLTTAPPR